MANSELKAILLIMLQLSLKVSQYFSPFRMLFLHDLYQNMVSLGFLSFACLVFLKMKIKILFLVGLRLATSILQFAGLSDFCIHYIRYPLLVDCNDSKYNQVLIFANTIVKTLPL